MSYDFVRDGLDVIEHNMAVTDRAIELIDRRMQEIMFELRQAQLQYAWECLNILTEELDAMQGASIDVCAACVGQSQDNSLPIPSGSENFGPA